MKRMLITGVSGLLGNNLAHHFKKTHTVLGLFHAHPVTIEGVRTEKADISSKKTLQAVFEKFSPDVVIHCASLTDVDFCEENRDWTKKINVHGSRFVVQALENTDARLVYISSDSVYNGKKGDFQEKDAIDPQNYYGLTKFEGEQEVLKRPGSLALRTNIFGWNIQPKSSIAEWIVGRLLENKPLNGFRDARFSSIYTLELARVIESALGHGLSGTYNCASRTSLSKYQFAVDLAKRFGLNGALVHPISIDDFGFKAKRGKNFSLSVDKLSHDLGSSLPTIQDSIDRFHQDFKDGLPQRIKSENGADERKTKSPFIPYGKQSIDEDDIQAVVNVLKSDFVTQGPKIKEFEEALCGYTGARYAVCVANGTAALHLACLAGGVQTGDEVITSPITFIASANSVLYCGGKPVFVDVQPATANIDPVKIPKKISKKTKAIIPVHFAGHPCDLQEIRKIAEKKKLLVIEDAAHALGAEYRGSKIGSGKYSDMTIFSFHPVKSITTGEGGAVLTNREDLYQKLLTLRNHGIVKDHFVRESEGDWYHEMQLLGYNHRMTDIQAALGVSQMKKLDSFIQRRREIAEFYDRAFQGNPLFDTPVQKKGALSSHHLYVVRLKKGHEEKRREVFSNMRDNGLGVQVHYIPVYRQPYYRKRFGYDERDFPVAEKYYQKAISLPIFPKMSESDAKRVVDVTLRIAQNA